MPAGQMDQRITLQCRVQTPDGMGGQLDSWQDFQSNPSVWAKVTPKSGRENLSGEGRMVASFVVLFEIWNRQDVSDVDRIVWQGVAYNIRGLRQGGERRATLVVEAERGVAS